MKRSRLTHPVLWLLIIAAAVATLIATQWQREPLRQWRHTLASWFETTEVVTSGAPNDHAGTPRSDDKAADKRHEPTAKLLAEWRSFSYSPPRYAIEILRVYDDWSCEVKTTGGEGGQPCSWKRIPGDQFAIRFPGNDNRLNARLAPPLSIAGRKQSGTASYLFVTLDDKHRQSFVLAGSADEGMVVDTVKAGYEWNHGNYRKATALYRRAITQGSDPARLRLAWILATVREFQQPKTALRLLAPLESDNKPAIAHALAAAYAADQQYAKAASIAEGACRNSPEARRAACLERLALYRNGQAYTTSVAPVRQ